MRMSFASHVIRMLARVLPGILPEMMSSKESLDVVCMYFIVDQLPAGMPRTGTLNSSSLGLLH